MLHRRRKRLGELAEREAAGESFWTDKFDQRVRTKLAYAFRDAAGAYVVEAATNARGFIVRDEGLPFLQRADLPPTEDFYQYHMKCPDDVFPTVVEAMVAALRLRTQHPYGGYAAAEAFGKFVTTVSDVLREHRISYELIEGQMVEYKSKEMHTAVVAPTLSLLSGRKDFGKVESAYRDSLDEISHGKPGDAITDAGTALQEALTALGCSGNSLGPLINSAKTKGLLAPHDSPLLDNIAKIVQWVSADRSESGDSHAASPATLDDAWFIVHIAGAVILRLAGESPRGVR